jgi:protein gp37
MSNSSKIEWTNATWNPVTGCSKISEGCRNCYAEKLSKRLNKMGLKNYRNGFDLTLQPHMLNKPMEWKKSKKIFVNSMSDLFHKKVPGKYFMEVMEIMSQAKHHIFQILTKRSSRLAELSQYLDWPENVWVGVTVESDKYTYRIDNLRSCGAKVKFLSLEPLLTPLPDLNLEGIDWVIVGGESGFGARPMEKDWVIDIRDQCVKANVPFYFKQWGGANKKKAGRLLEGMTWDEMPDQDLFLKK